MVPGKVWKLRLYWHAGVLVNIDEYEYNFPTTHDLAATNSLLGMFGATTKGDLIGCEIWHMELWRCRWQVNQGILIWIDLIFVQRKWIFMILLDFAFACFWMYIASRKGARQNKTESQTLIASEALLSSTQPLQKMCHAATSKRPNMACLSPSSLFGLLGNLWCIVVHPWTPSMIIMLCSLLLFLQATVYWDLHDIEK